MNILINNIRISTVNEAIDKKNRNNPLIHDFEDVLDYYSALAQQCECIITQNLDDFYFSDIPVMDAEGFLVHHF